MLENRGGTFTSHHHHSIHLPESKSLIPPQFLQKNQSSKLTSTEGKHTALQVDCCQPTERVKETGKQMIPPTPLLNIDL